MSQDIKISVKMYDFSGRHQHKEIVSLPITKEDFYGYFTGKGKSLISKQQGKMVKGPKGMALSFLLIDMIYSNVSKMSPDDRSVIIVDTKDLDSKKLKEKFLSNVTLDVKFVPKSS